MIADYESLPHNEESERAVLGAILLGALREASGEDGPNPILAGLESLREEDFYFRRNTLIFSAMRQIDADELPIDLRTLHAHLGDDLLEEVGGIAYLSQLDLDLPDPSRVEVYAAQIREAAARRRAIQSAGELIRAALEEPRAGADGRVQGRAFAARIEEHQGRLAAVAAGLPGLRSRWRSVAQVEERDGVLRPASTKEIARKLRTGIPGLDRAGILGPGEVVAIAGRPRAGKSVLGLQIAASVAIDQGLPVGIFSLEMSSAEQTFRLLAARSGVEYHKVRRKELNFFERQAVEDAMDKVRAAPLLFDDRPALGCEAIGSSVRRLLREHPELALVVVDYLGIMELPGSSREPMTYRLGQVSRFLVNLARTTGVAVMPLTQIGRRGEKVVSARPTLDDLADSDAVGRDSVTVIAIHRKPQQDRPDRLEEDGELLGLKHRVGGPFEVAVRFQGAQQKFVEIGS